MTVQLKGRLLSDRIEIEKNLGIEAKKDCLPMQPGDVKATYADIDEGIKKFVEWYMEYCGRFLPPIAP